MTKLEIVDRRKNVVILWMLLGFFGVHRFYDKYLASGLLMMTITMAPFTLILFSMNMGLNSLIQALPIIAILWVITFAWWAIDGVWIKWRYDRLEAQAEL